MNAIAYWARELHDMRHAGVGGESCPRCVRDVEHALRALPEHAVLATRIAHLEMGLEAANIANEVLRATLDRSAE